MHLKEALFRLSMIATMLLLVAGDGAAASTETYFKSGWFKWKETIDGNAFVNEEGWMNCAGMKGRRLGPLTLEGVVEVCGGDLSYDGHDLGNRVPIMSRTTNVGTREEVAAGVPLTGGPLWLEPFLAVDHRFWIRTRSGEDWNTFSIKGGAGAEISFRTFFIFARGGILYPLYTRNHADLTGSGQGDVVTYPRPALSCFGEVGLRFQLLEVALEYEGMRFRHSASVDTTPQPLHPGVAVNATRAFQPDTVLDSVFLRLGYLF